MSCHGINVFRRDKYCFIPKTALFILLGLRGIVTEASIFISSAMIHGAKILCRLFSVGCDSALSQLKIVSSPGECWRKEQRRLQMLSM
jgi:hypothetical protein